MVPLVIILVNLIVKRFFRYFQGTLTERDSSLILMASFWKPEATLLNKRSCLAPTLGVTKFIRLVAVIVITLCCAPKVRFRCSTNPPQFVGLAAALRLNNLIVIN